MKRRLAIVPAYNEEPTLPHLVERLQALPLALDICLVDDGSSDATRLWQSCGRLFVLHHACRLGYGSAIQSGFRFALARGYDEVATLDGDGQHEVADLPRLFAALEDRGADLVVGSRFLAPSRAATGWRRRAGIRLLRLALRLCGGPSLSDPTSGYLACRASLLPFFCSDFFPDDYPDANLLLMLSRMRRSIAEVGVTMYPRRSGHSMHDGLPGWQYPWKMGLMMLVAALDPSYKRRFAEDRGGR